MTIPALRKFLYRFYMVASSVDSSASDALPTSTPFSQADLPLSELNLIWIDLEMTGLNPDAERIIELAVVVTDPQVRIRVEGPVLAIHQSDALLNKIGRAHV